MDYKKKIQTLVQLSPVKLSETLVLLGDWLPVAKQVVELKVAFTKTPLCQENLEEAIRENVSIEKNIPWDQCGPYSIIIGEIHDHLRDLSEGGHEKLAQDLGRLVLEIGEQSSELLAEPDCWEMGLQELEEWLA